MEYGPFADRNGVAIPPDAAAAVAAKHNAAGLTDDGTRPIAVKLESPIAYYDPGMPVGHGPAVIAKNTLQQAHAVAAGFLTDVAQVKKLRAAAQAAKDAE